jgi:DNA-binding transcriptional MerR regulator
MSYTIGQLAERCHLSRSTLLYYSNIGLLTPENRTAAGYRVYSENDRIRLDRIIAFRALGIELKNIKELLELENQKPLGVFLKRLFEINDSIVSLRNQQKEIIGMLELDHSVGDDRQAIKDNLSKTLAEGPRKFDFRHFHSVFEKCSPEEHKRLLHLLGFSEPEYSQIIKEITGSP